MTVEGLSGDSGATPSPPAWLPDERTLSQLASAFFSALPGQDGSSDSVLPNAAAGPPMNSAPGFAGAPDIQAPFGGVPAQPFPTGLPTPTGAPSGFPDAAPSSGLPLPGNASAGLPASPDLEVPRLDMHPPNIQLPDFGMAAPVDAGARSVAPVSIPSSPYYFIGETSPYHRDLGLNPDLELDHQKGGHLDRLDTPLDKLDHQRGLDQQRGLDEQRGLDQQRGPGQRHGTEPRFYFLDAPPAAHSAHPAFDVNAVRRDFPILAEKVNGKPLVWLDNAATTHKPQAVIDRLSYFYAHENSNIHRAAHTLAARATDAYEGARAKVARFLGAGSANEIVFVRGATEAINLVAKTWGKANLKSGDEIVISHLEHHANIVPWQQIAAETGAVIKVIPVDDRGQIRLDRYTEMMSDRTKIVAVTHVSNALGTITPVREIIELGHRAGACVLIDGAQSVPHLRVNVQALDADFYLFSGHKIFGPTGIGALYGKAAILDKMPPWQGGGNMIADVTFEKTVYQAPPNKFEAGTGNIADAVGLGAALDYVNRLGLENIAAYEHYLLEYATPRMLEVPGLTLIGTAAEKASVLSFVLEGYRTEEVGTALNNEGIAVRSGHHCAQPILRRFGQETTVRPSLAMYNTCAEIDLMVSTLHRLAADKGRR